MTADRRVHYVRHVHKRKSQYDVSATNEIMNRVIYTYFSDVYIYRVEFNYSTEIIQSNTYCFYSRSSYNGKSVNGYKTVNKVCKKIKEKIPLAISRLVKKSIRYETPLEILMWKIY